VDTVDEVLEAALGPVIADNAKPTPKKKSASKKATKHAKNSPR